jgi:hypothetical protein
MFREIGCKRMLKFEKDHGGMKDAKYEMHKVVFF